MVFTLFHTLGAVSMISFFTETPIWTSSVCAPCIDVTTVSFTQTLVQIWWKQTKHNTTLKLQNQMANLPQVGFNSLSEPRVWLYRPASQTCIRFESTEKDLHKYFFVLSQEHILTRRKGLGKSLKNNFYQTNDYPLLTSRQSFILNYSFPFFSLV